MSRSNRKNLHEDYYTQNDFEQITLGLPGKIMEARLRAGETMEPTIEEQVAVMAVIKNFIRRAKRKVYGGTALNEQIKVVSPDETFYTEKIFGDIEFYTPEPALDMAKICIELYQAGFKDIIGKEAQHEETYKIYVNLRDYCDITYTPKMIYHAIKTNTIDGIQYVDPHFALIDQLRIFTDPYGAADFRWEKTFDRMYKSLKLFPLEQYDNKHLSTPPSREVKSVIRAIKAEFLPRDQIKDMAIIIGLHAYNIYRKNSESAVTKSNQKFPETKFEIDAPELTFISFFYTDFVIAIFDFIKTQVKNPDELSLEEHTPFFQFAGRSVLIKYRGETTVKIYDADGKCVPYNRVRTGDYAFGAYQLTLLWLLIEKFYYYVHQKSDNLMYLTMGTAISNIVDLRNMYLDVKGLTPIDTSVFGEFKSNCIGPTISYLRQAAIRNREKKRLGKTPFVFRPESFAEKTKEEQQLALENIAKHKFNNTSGYIINNPQSLVFDIQNGSIVLREHAVTESESSPVEKPVNEDSSSTSSSDSLDDL